MLVIFPSFNKLGYKIPARTSLLNEMGTCPNTYGFPILHSVTESKGNFSPAALIIILNEYNLSLNFKKL